MVFNNKLAGIEYVGVPGVSVECQEAVMRLLQFRDRITLARILTSNSTHCLLLTVNGDSVAVKSGFASGYGGEGPRRFSYVIQLLKTHGVEIEEYEVNANFLERLDQSALTVADLKNLRSTKQVRPTRWHEYVFDKHYEQFRNGTLWQEFTPVIPFGIIDSRLTDLAVSFWDNANGNIFTGYTRLEDIVRKRTGLKKGSAELFSQTFGGASPVLRWKKIDEGERFGRTDLFRGAYMTHRNPRAHSEQKGHDHDRALGEFLVLNHLYKLEKKAYRVRRSSKTQGVVNDAPVKVKPLHGNTK